MVSAHGFKDFVLRICQLTHDLSAPIVPRRADAGNKEVSMAREKQGYRDALERIRHEAAGELVTVPEAAHIVYGTAGSGPGATNASRPPRWQGKFADDNG